MYDEVQALFNTVSLLYEDADGFDGIVVRCVATKYANQNDFFSGTGAAKSGGRWNPVGLEAIYASLDIRTAIEEAYQNFNTFGFSLSSIRPRTTAGAFVHLKSVLDLRDAQVRQALGFSKRELREEDWRAIQQSGDESWTQTIGKACAAAGFDGLIAPSARLPVGNNLVIFPKNMSEDKQITILGADQLPK